MVKKRFTCPVKEGDVVAVSEVGPGDQVGFRAQCPLWRRCKAGLPDGILEQTVVVSGSRQNPDTRARAPKRIARQAAAACAVAQQMMAAEDELFGDAQPKPPRSRRRKGSLLEGQEGPIQET